HLAVVRGDVLRDGGEEVAESPSVKTLAGRLALLTLGIVLALAVVEAALRTLALVPRSRVTAFGERGRTLLFVGDSNTYGLYVDARESYPAQVERLWNARH